MLPVGELASLLVLVGQGNLSAERIREAHVDVLLRMARNETSAAWRAAPLFGLWVTDPSRNCLRMRQSGDRIFLHGGKRFCSGAKLATGTLAPAR